MLYKHKPAIYFYFIMLNNINFCGDSLQTCNSWEQNFKKNYKTGTKNHQERKKKVTCYFKKET